MNTVQKATAILNACINKHFSVVPTDLEEFGKQFFEINDALRAAVRLLHEEMLENIQ